MLLATDTVARLADRLQAATGPMRHAVVDAPGLDPLTFVRSGSPLVGKAFYFAAPGGDAIGGLGVAWQATASGPDRFLRLEQAAGAAPLPAGLPYLVGFAFHPDGSAGEDWEGFPAAVAAYPQLLAVRSASTTRLAVAVPAGRREADLLATLEGLEALPPPALPELGDHTVESRPSPATWREEVEDAVGAIRAGTMRKVVLARSVSVTAEYPAAPFDLVHLLEQAYPQCYAFGWQSGQATFIGATPELLVSQHGGTIRCNPLAGSARRGEGDNEDHAIGRTLMLSAKDRLEHQLVVEDIVARLEPMTSSITVPDTPSLKRIATVQHLSTEIIATRRRPGGILDLADLLHPTPAVGGVPRSDAVAFIDKVEGLDRGWYAGGIGWALPGGDGEIALSLRCGLIRGTEACLFAGAGVVADSDPDAELTETRLKFRPLLNLLTAT